MNADDVKRADQKADSYISDIHKKDSLYNIK